MNTPTWIYQHGYIPSWICQNGYTNMDIPTRIYTIMDMPTWIYQHGYTNMDIYHHGYANMDIISTEVSMDITKCWCGWLGVALKHFKYKVLKYFCWAKNMQAESHTAKKCLVVHNVHCMNLTNIKKVFIMHHDVPHYFTLSDARRFYLLIKEN